MRTAGGLEVQCRRMRPTQFYTLPNALPACYQFVCQPMNPPSQPTPDPAPSGGLAAGQTVGGGRYVLKQRLGAGGMGVVWLAHDKRLREPVALKFPPPQISFDPVAIDHLRRETLRSRRLSHPNIVRIHDLHEAPGEPVFISMEFVDGPNLHDLRARRPLRVLTWKFLAPLMRQLCQALDYAHAEGILHRDLKPANIMLDANGRLKLADFGLACVLSDPSAHTAGKTGGGTLPYMSPQQAEGHRPNVADDIYSLGATLYELLTSKPPFHAGDIAHQVQHTRPDAPVQRLLDLALTNEIPSEVSALLLSCLAKDPAQRPPGAKAILDWLDPIEPSRSSVTASAPPPAPEPAQAVALELSAITTKTPSRPSPELAARIERTEPKPASTPAPSRGLVVTAIGVVGLLALGGFGGWLWWKGKASPPVRLAAETSPATGVVEIIAPPTAAPTIILLPGAGPPPAVVPARITGVITSLDFSPDGRTVASAGEDGTVRMWGRNDGRVGPVFKGHQGVVNAVAFSPVNNRLMASAGADGSVRLWDVTNSARHRILNGHRGPVNAVAFSRDGATLWSAGDDGTLKLWDVSNGMFRRSLNDHKAPVLSLASSPAGPLMASGDRNGTIRLWNLVAGASDAALTGHTLPVTSLAISPDGRLLASASNEKGIHTWNLGSRPLRRVYPVAAEVQSLAWGDSGMIVFGGDDGGLHSLDVSTGRLNKPVAGPRRPVRALARSVDGILAMGAIGGHVTYWNPRTQFNPGSPGPVPDAASAQPVAVPSPAGLPSMTQRLFNGRDLAGWKAEAGSEIWAAASGGARASFSSATPAFQRRHLVFQQPVGGDFQLSFSFKLNSGHLNVWYLAEPQLSSWLGYAYTVQAGRAGSVLSRPSNSESAMGFGGIVIEPAAATEWHDAVITVRNRTAVHLLDGQPATSAEHPLALKRTSGLIVLEASTASGGGKSISIELKDVILRTLPAETARRPGR